MVGPDPWQELLDDARTREAGAARSRERWLRRAAAEDTTLVGALLDLVEARAEATVQSASGRAHRGRIVVVGRDVVAVQADAGPLALIALASVVSVRPAAGSASVGSRTRPDGPGLLELLAALAPEGETVRLTAPGGTTTRGRVAGIGADVVPSGTRTGRGRRPTCRPARSARRSSSARGRGAPGCPAGPGSAG